MTDLKAMTKEELVSAIKFPSNYPPGANSDTLGAELTRRLNRLDKADKIIGSLFSVNTWLIKEVSGDPKSWYYICPLCGKSYKPDYPNRLSLTGPKCDNEDCPAVRARAWRTK